MFKYSFLLLFIGSFTSLNAQLNSVSKKILVKQGLSDNSVLIKSHNQAPSILISSIGIGYDTLHLAPSGQSNEWKITFKPEQGFTGTVTVPIEYAQNGGIPGLVIKKYSEIAYEIRNSIIESSNDFYLSDGLTQVLDVLSNDQSKTDGPLNLDVISYVKGGSANIINNEIEFTLDANEDVAYIQYTTKDSTDNANHAIACLVRENSLPAQISKAMHNRESLLLHLDDANAAPISGPSNGTLDMLSDIVYEYTPNANYMGDDQIIFEDQNGNSNNFDINVFNKAYNDGFIRDDEIYTPISTSVQFDVFENDLKSSFNIVDFSSELNYLGNGVFDYAPVAGFEGDQIFYYKVFTGVAFKTGNILVHVSDQAPVETIDYNFNILKNEHLELAYLPSIANYTYDISVAPSNGNLVILDNQGIVAAQCEDITGQNKIIFSPNPGFSGTDHFDIEYCTPSSGNCKIVKINIEVSNNEASNCVCYNDCVWPGDANGDGISNVQDYLLSNLLLGHSGASRDSIESDWSAKKALDWNFSAEKTNIDYKHCDANGDGTISTEDIDVVNNNYGKLHNMIGKGAFQLDDLPVYLVPQNIPVDSGEYLYLDILLGDTNIPAIDFHGLGMNLNIDPELMDSSSVYFSALNNSWVGLEGPINTMLDVPEDGKINIGVTTISNISPTGEGIIGTLGFIVEDDLAGWRLESSIIDMTISANNIIFMNAQGESYLLPEQSVKVPVETNPTITDFSSTVNLYPNPSVNKSFLSSSKYAIEHVQIVDIAGRVLETISRRNNDLIELDTQHLQDGFYFVKVSVGGQIVTKKLNKISL